MGVYALRSPRAAEVVEEASEPPEDDAHRSTDSTVGSEPADQMRLINAFGMFWRRSEVNWANRQPRLSEFSSPGAKASTSLPKRVSTSCMTETVSYTWFGVRKVEEDGSLGPISSKGIQVATLIATMEALLIEGLEPPQNRRKGDGFNAMEFLQVMDPEVALKHQRELLAELAKGLGK
jgi:hypothetical protein